MKLLIQEVLTSAETPVNAQVKEPALHGAGAKVSLAVQLELILLATTTRPRTQWALTDALATPNALAHAPALHGAIAKASLDVTPSSSEQLCLLSLHPMQDLD